MIVHQTVFLTAEAGGSGEAMDVDDTTAATSGSTAAAKAGEDEDYSEEMNDPAYLQSVLENLPGVDPQSDAVKSAMGAITGQEKKKDGEGSSGGASKEDKDKKKKEQEKKDKK